MNTLATLHLCCKIFISFLIIITLIQPSVFSQQSKLSKGVNYISEFIASDYFKELSKNNSDLALVDTIYLRAVHFINYDYSEALLTLTFATVPYKKVPIRLPLFNIVLKFPLTSAGDSVFQIKNKNLPKRLFFDTPAGEYGDRDKLAHFFGSAYISYASRIFDLGNLIGYFIETFEEKFKIQSSIDSRDMRTNTLGKTFGKILKENESILPSQIFIIYTLQFILINI